MTWPAAQVKTNVDAATDDPKLARSDFAANVDKFNQLQGHVTSFMQGLLDDADAATGRATLGAAALAANTFTGAQTLNSALYLAGVISPAQITANTNNYNPTGLSGAVALRLSTDASRNITGLQGTGTGRIINIINVGSFDLVLVNQSASSTAGNRFLFAGGDLTLSGDQSVLLRYDNTTSRWRRANETPAGIFTESFTSTNQTITSAGSLTLAHSLSATPTLIQCLIECQTAELNYSVNDQVVINPSLNSAGGSQGISIVPDGTNVNVRFGSDASAIRVLNKTTGADAGITNGNWQLIVRAWA